MHRECHVALRIDPGSGSSSTKHPWRETLLHLLRVISPSKKQKMQQFGLVNACPLPKCLKLRNSGPITHNSLHKITKIACTCPSSIVKRSLHSYKCCQVHKCDSSIVSSNSRAPRGEYSRWVKCTFVVQAASTE